MGWRKFKRLLREKPYLADESYRLGGPEIDALLKGGFPSFDETLAAAKRRSNLPGAAWPAKRRGVFARLSAARPRRLAVAALALALLLGFFTLTPPGRTIARELYRIVVEIIGDRMVFRDDGATESPGEGDGDALGEMEIVEEAELRYDSLTAFTADTGRSPIRLDAGYGDVLEVVFYPDRPRGADLRAAYETPDGLRVTLIQTFLSGPYDESVLTAIDPEFFALQLPGGETLHCAVDADDGSFFGVAFLGNIELKIMAEKGVDYEDLIRALIIP